MGTVRNYMKEISRESEKRLGLWVRETDRLQRFVVVFTRFLWFRRVLLIVSLMRALLGCVRNDTWLQGKCPDIVGG